MSCNNKFDAIDHLIIDEVCLEESYLPLPGLQAVYGILICKNVLRDS